MIEGVSMISSLVPSNHKPLERALAQTLEPIAALNPSLISTIWSAWECPKALLPWLAYALSVDFWDDAWDEVQKRRIIEQSPAYHRRKGTRAAVEEAASFTGREADIIEWWQQNPKGRRGTFRIYLHLKEGEDTLPPASEIILVNRFIRNAKPKSRSYRLNFARIITHKITPYVGRFSNNRTILSVATEPATAQVKPIIWRDHKPNRNIREVH